MKIQLTLLPLIAAFALSPAAVAQSFQGAQSPCMPQTTAVLTCSGVDASGASVEAALDERSTCGSTSRSFRGVIIFNRNVSHQSAAIKFESGSLNGQLESRQLTGVTAGTNVFNQPVFATAHVSSGEVKGNENHLTINARGSLAGQAGQSTNFELIANLNCQPQGGD